MVHTASQNDDCNSEFSSVHAQISRDIWNSRDRCVALAATTRASRDKMAIARAKLTPTICPCATRPRLTPMVSSRLSMVAPLSRPLPLSFLSFRSCPSPSSVSESDNLGDKGEVASMLVPKSSSWGFGGSLLIGDARIQRRQKSVEGRELDVAHYRDEGRNADGLYDLLL